MKIKLDLRQTSQIYFIIFYLVTGIFFYQAVHLLPILGETALQYRFPAVEAFLPISALLAVKQWLVLGIWDSIHPAGLTILLLAIGSALLFKRGFCSHLCPVGTVSELVGELCRQLPVRLPPIHRLLHYVLLLPKYLILGFFLYIIFLNMTTEAVVAFLHSPYNIVSDVKMLQFFLEPSALTLQVITVLLLLTLLVQNFWCRYLCPYGALLNLFAIFSPLTIRRDCTTCSSCRQCDRTCPSEILISTAHTVTSPECTLCQKCLKVCPETGTLSIRSRVGGIILKPFHYSALIIGFFMLGIGLAKLTGYWESPLLAQFWIKFVPMLQLLGHP